MAYYHKCRNCALDKNTCAKRSAVRSAVQGLGVTAIKFKCAGRIPRFGTGQRVSFEWHHWDESARDAYGECERDSLVFFGTVVCELEREGRFLVRVDSAPVASSLDPDVTYSPKDVFKNGGFAVKVKPSVMRALPEPNRDICPDCLGYNKSERCQASEWLCPSVLAMCRAQQP